MSYLVENSEDGFSRDEAHVIAVHSSPTHSTCQDSIISLVSIFEISSLKLASVAVQASLCLTGSQTPKTGFLVPLLIWHNRFCHDVA